MCEQLLDVPYERLLILESICFLISRGTQYRHGVYYHNNVQKKIAERIINSFGSDCVTEVLPAKKFFDAEPYHMQYLLKGGQSAKKGDESPIRCYG